MPGPKRGFDRLDPAAEAWPRPPPPAPCGSGRRRCRSPRGPAECRPPCRAICSSFSSAGRSASATSGCALTQASSTRSSGPSTPGVRRQQHVANPGQQRCAAGEPAAGVEARRQRAGAGQADRRRGSGGCRTGRNSSPGCGPSRRCRSRARSRPGRRRPRRPSRSSSRRGSGPGARGLIGVPCQTFSPVRP